MNLKYTSIDKLPASELSRSIRILERAIDPDNVEQMDESIIALAYAGVSAAILSMKLKSNDHSKAAEEERFKFLLNEGKPFSRFLGEAIECALIHSHAINCADARKTEKTLEKDYGDAIELNWPSIFPYLDLVAREYKLEEGDRLDFFAFSKDGNQPVIIELKLGNKSAHKQLRSYAVEFNNPILINISETLPSNPRPDIIYKTFKELGIDSNAVYATELGE